MNTYREVPSRKREELIMSMAMENGRQSRRATGANFAGVRHMEVSADGLER